MSDAPGWTRGTVDAKKPQRKTDILGKENWRKKCGQQPQDSRIPAVHISFSRWMDGWMDENHIVTKLTTKPKVLDFLWRLPGRTRRFCLTCGELVPDFLVVVVVVVVATHSVTSHWSAADVAASSSRLGSCLYFSVINTYTLENWWPGKAMVIGSGRRFIDPYKNLPWWPITHYDPRPMTDRFDHKKDECINSKQCAIYNMICNRGRQKNWDKQFAVSICSSCASNPKYACTESLNIAIDLLPWVFYCEHYVWSFTMTCWASEITVGQWVKWS